MEGHKRQIDILLYSLFCKRSRRQCLILKWHTMRPVKGNTVKEVFKQFVLILLHNSIQIYMYKDAICFFKNEELRIPYSWLTVDELEIVKYMFVHRKDIFIHVDDVNCVLKYTKCGLSLDMDYRREMVRDFAQFVTTLKKDKAIYLKSVLLQSLQQIIAEEPFKTDRFLFELHFNLQKNVFPLQDIIIRN